MHIGPLTAGRLRRVSPGPVLLVVTGAAMLAWTWRAWPDPLVDFGRELYVPWRLAEGDHLFADIAWFNGPLSQYWNALLFKTFGVGLSVLVWANVAVLAACVWMLYALIARISDRLTATAAGMSFLLIFAFGQYVGIANYNWITPYSHEVTHGIMLAVASVVALDRWTRTDSVWFAAFAGLALGLCFLTKVETFVAGALASLVLLQLAVRRRDVRALGAFVGAATVPVVTSILLVGGRGTLGAWPSVLSGEVAKLPFYRAIMGLDQPGLRLEEIAAWAGLWLLALGVPVAVSWLARETRTLTVPLAAGAGSLLALWLMGSRVYWGDAVRPLPFFIVWVAVFQAAAARREEGVPNRTTSLAFTVLGFALLWKIILYVRVSHYGFALAMPAFMVLVTALVGWLPAWLDERRLRGQVFRACMLVLLGIFALEHLAATNAWLRRKSEIVGRGRDAFRSDVRGAFVDRAVDYVRRSRARSVAVLPEGVIINYLSRTPSPTRYVNFMPPEEILFGDEAWVDAFRRSPPDLIIIVPKDTSEFGRGPFGVGYGKALAAWINTEYAPENVIRIEGVPFELRVLARR